MALTPNQAASAILMLMRQGYPGLELQSMVSQLEIKKHKTKGPSKPGKTYRASTSRYIGVKHTKEQENTRRVRQMEKLAND